jgi:hypothetical protein
MQHMHRVLHTHGVNCAEGVSLVILDEFINSRTESFSVLRGAGCSTELDYIQCDAQVFLHGYWKVLESLPRGTFPVQKPAYFRHGTISVRV